MDHPRPAPTRRPRRPRRRRSRRAAPALLAAGAASLLLAGTPAGPPDGDEQALRRDARAVVDAGAVGVLADLRADGRRWTARAGVADLTTRAPVPPDSRLRIGSTTKAFTAVVVLQLVGEGRLSLDDTVESRLPGLVTGNGNDGRLITVRQLLQHTSGLPQALDDLPGQDNAADFLRYRFDSHTPEEIVRLAMRHPPSSAPGTRWEYSNTNYVLAGMIVERVTGKPWAYEVMRRILVPLGLEDTVVPGDNPFLPRPHMRAYRAFAPGEPWVDTTTQNVRDMDAEGSIVGTTADLARFWSALAGGELLSPDLLARMRQTVPVPEYEEFGMRYGLGLMWFSLSCGGGYWTHWGDTLGTSTRGGITPDGRRVVVVATSGNGDHIGLDIERKALHPMVDRALCGAR